VPVAWFSDVRSSTNKDLSSLKEKVEESVTKLTSDIQKLGGGLAKLTSEVGDEFSRLNEKIKDAGTFTTNVGAVDAILAAIAIGLAVFALRKITKLKVLFFLFNILVL
jgi:hypothetical protein